MRKTVMIRVAEATRNRLAAFQAGLQKAVGGRRKVGAWWDRKKFGTLDAALGELLDRHDRHQARNRKASNAARERRQRKRGLLQDLAEAAEFRAEQHQAAGGNGVADGEA